MIVNTTIKNQKYRISFDVNLKKFIKRNLNNYYKVAILTDNNLYKIYKDILKIKGLLVLKIKPGETSKSHIVKNRLESIDKVYALNRNSLLIGLGGGVVGDLTGFIAATLLRGVDLIHIPTSLVAIVDSSIGGKTGINSNMGKNLIGSFYNPTEIVVNTKFLETLPDKEIRQGLGEIIKYGIIKDLKLFRKLESSNVRFMENNKKDIASILKKCMEIKIKVVQKDFKESDLRSILNFGHTIGHAIEKLYSYKKSHGDCIGVGMAIESILAHEYFDLKHEDLLKIINILDKFGLRRVTYNINQVELLLDYMQLDKKNKGSSITFSLPCKIGTIMKIKDKHTVEVGRKTIKKVLIKYLNEFKNI